MLFRKNVELQRGYLGDLSLSKAEANGGTVFGEQYLETVFGKQLVTSGKKMIICLRSSIYPNKITYLHLWHHASKLNGLISVLIGLIPLYTSVKVLFIFG